MVGGHLVLVALGLKFDILLDQLVAAIFLQSHVVGGQHGIPGGTHQGRVAHDGVACDLDRLLLYLLGSGCQHVLLAQSQRERHVVLAGLGNGQRLVAVLGNGPVPRVVTHHLVVIALGLKLNIFLDQLVGAIVLQRHQIGFVVGAPVRAHECLVTGNGVVVLNDNILDLLGHGGERAACSILAQCQRERHVVLAVLSDGQRIVTLLGNLPKTPNMIAHYLVLIAACAELDISFQQLVGAVALQRHVVVSSGRVPVCSHQSRIACDGIARDLNGWVGGLILPEIAIDGIGEEVVSVLQRNVLRLHTVLVEDDKPPGPLERHLVVLRAVDLGERGSLGDECARPTSKLLRAPCVDIECGVISRHIDVGGPCLQPDYHHGQQAHE